MSLIKHQKARLCGLRFIVFYGPPSTCMGRLHEVNHTFLRCLSVYVIYISCIIDHYICACYWSSYLLEEINLLNGYQYFERLVSTITYRGYQIHQKSCIGHKSTYYLSLPLEKFNGFGKFFPFHSHSCNFVVSIFFIFRSLLSFILASIGQGNYENGKGNKCSVFIITRCLFLYLIKSMSQGN